MSKSRSNRKQQGATRRDSRRTGLMDRIRYGVALLCRIAVGGLVALLVWVGGSWFVEQMNQPVDQIVVSGDLRYGDVEQLRDVLSGAMRESDAKLPDLEMAYRQLLAQPWIASASLRIRWPGILHAQVTERVPVARWNEDHLITDGAEPFTPPAIDGFDELPQLKGSDGSAAELWSEFQGISNRLDAYGVRLVALEKQGRGAWQMAIAAKSDVSGFALPVLVGRESVGKKLARLGKLLNKGLLQQLNDLQQIDMRYSNGVALQWKHMQVAS